MGQYRAGGLYHAFYVNRDTGKANNYRKIIKLFLEFVIFIFLEKSENVCFYCIIMLYRGIRGRCTI